jgi:hypothetical protein
MGEDWKYVVVNINGPLNRCSSFNIMCAEEDSWISPPLRFPGRQLFCLSNCVTEERESFSRIQIWKMQEMNNNLILIHDRPLDHRGLQMEYADDKFIVACVGVEPRKFWFISTETLNDVLAVRVKDHADLTYNRGLSIGQPDFQVRTAYGRCRDKNGTACISM